MAGVGSVAKYGHGLADCRFPLALREVVDREFDATSIAMQIVDQRRFVGKIVSADIHDGLSKHDGLNDGAVTWFGHDDIDRGK